METHLTSHSFFLVVLSLCWAKTMLHLPLGHMMLVYKCSGALIRLVVVILKGCNTDHMWSSITQTIQHIRGYSEVTILLL